MYPVLFRIGSFEVTSFGVLVAIAALIGIWLFGRELARSGLPRDGVDEDASAHPRIIVVRDEVDVLALRERADEF